MNETYDELASLIVYGLDMEKKIASGNIRRLNAGHEKWLHRISTFWGSLGGPIIRYHAGSSRGRANALIFGF